MDKISDVLARFGSVREAATKIGRPPSVIQYWRAQNRVPATAQESVLVAAAKYGIALEAGDLVSRSTVAIVECDEADDAGRAAA